MSWWPGERWKQNVLTYINVKRKDWNNRLMEQAAGNLMQPCNLLHRCVCVCVSQAYPACNLSSVGNEDLIKRLRRMKQISQSIPENIWLKRVWTFWTKCVEHYRILHLSSTLFSVQTATGSILRCTVNRNKMMCRWYLFSDTVGGGITNAAVYSTAPGLERTILGGGKQWHYKSERLSLCHFNVCIAAGSECCNEVQKTPSRYWVMQKYSETEQWRADRLFFHFIWIREKWVFRLIDRKYICFNKNIIELWLIYPMSIHKMYI